MTSLLNEMDVFVLPVFNVDGYEYTHKSVRYAPFKPFYTEAVLQCFSLLIYHVHFVHLGTLGQDVEENSFQEFWILHRNRPQQELQRWLVQ